MLSILLPILLFFTALFLVLLVLIQRGRGGGLAGAFGGMGGQSAFGTKAGDLFTRITIGVAAFWIILCALSVKLLSDTGQSKLGAGFGKNAAPAPEVPGAAGGTRGVPGTSSPAPPAAGTQQPAAQTTPAGDTAPAPVTTTPAEATTPAAASPPATPPAEAPATGEGAAKEGK